MIIRYNYKPYTQTEVIFLCESFKINAKVDVGR